MPWYPGDHLADTFDLTPMQDLFYRRLLDHCWLQGGPAELDLLVLRKKVRAVGQPQAEAVKFVLERYFEKRRDGWHNKRLNIELRNVREKIKQKVFAGKLSGEARKAKARANLRTDDEQTFEQNANKTRTKTNEQNRTDPEQKKETPLGMDAVSRAREQARRLFLKSKDQNPKPQGNTRWKVPPVEDTEGLQRFAREHGIDPGRFNGSYMDLFKHLVAMVTAENAAKRTPNG